MQQGTKANVNGSRLENRIEQKLSNLSIKYIKQHKYDSIYNHQGKMDFYLPDIDTAVEAKNQEVSGSVAEKIPYVMFSFEKHPAVHSLLVLGGNYWKTSPGIINWAKNYANSSSKHINIIFEEELEEWLFEQTSKRNST